MIGERPIRVVLAALALAAAGAAALVDLAGLIGKRLACVPGCTVSFGVGDVLFLATPIILLGLAAGLVLRADRFRAPAAIISPLLIARWFIPIVSSDAPDVADLAAAAVLAGTPFLLYPPIGATVTRRVRVAWALMFIVALTLVALDEFGSKFMRGSPAPPQSGFSWSPPPSLPLA